MNLKPVKVIVGAVGTSLGLIGFGASADLFALAFALMSAAYLTTAFD